MDKFTKLAEKVISKAERVDCSLEEFESGLTTMIEILEERRHEVQDEMRSR